MIQKQHVRFITLGCRVNQYETQGMRELMHRSGVDSWNVKTQDNKEDVDFVVVNTCTVTADADRENRYWIRRARREHPRAKIIVTGCGVVKDQDRIESMPEVDLVLENHKKTEIASRLEISCANPQGDESISKQDYAPLSISESEGRTRAFIKVQDGCNHACSFCKVVLVRGRSRSRTLQDILDEVVRLRDTGYRDFVFAGIQLGAYGYDLKESKSLRVADILYECSKIQGIERLRLSSIEPTDVEPQLIDALRDIPQCAHHLHIPLQSGDDEILKAMNRRYDRSFYIDLIERLKSNLTDFRLTMDVMAGFAGETEEQFLNTVRLIETVKPLRCHVFPYSPREGTRAFRTEAQEVDPKIKKERVSRLIALSDRLSREIRQEDLGKVMSVLVENSKGSREEHAADDEVLLQGLTTNFMRVHFWGHPDLIGQITPVKLVSVQGDVLLAKSLEPEALVNH